MDDPAYRFRARTEAEIPHPAGSVIYRWIHPAPVDDTLAVILSLLELDPVVDVLRSARRVLVITGAGMSADSGLPTYRGVGGLYNDRATEDGLPIEEALSGHMFMARPALTWKHIREIEHACRGAQPNAGHRVLAAWETRFDRVCVLTQNVDGLHRSAGSTRVIDIHGDTGELFCPMCDWQEIVSSYEHLEPLPLCPQCGAVIRPRVVLFGELLDPAKLDSLRNELVRGFDVVFSIGTSALFPYIVQPVLDAARNGVTSVEINPKATDISPLVTYQVRAGAADTLLALAHKLDP